MPNATPEEIETFLEQVRRIIHKSFETRRNDDYKKTLLALGFNKSSVINEISTITVENYSEGPKPEIGSINDVWIFGKTIQNQEIYIKLKIIGMNNRAEEIDTLYCLSFHFAEKCLVYPYK